MFTRSVKNARRQPSHACGDFSPLKSISDMIEVCTKSVQFMTLTTHTFELRQSSDTHKDDFFGNTMKITGLASRVFILVFLKKLVKHDIRTYGLYSAAHNIAVS